MRNILNFKNLLLVSLLGYSASSQAYFLIYSPYVEYGETEVELYVQHTQDDDPLIDGSQQVVLEFAKGVTPRLFLEGKIIAEKTPGSSLSTEEYAIEGVYQLTEQGEYSWDFGLLGELVYSTETDEFAEAEFGLTAAKELGGKLIFTTNIVMEYEKETSETESEVSGQFKWRLKPTFEPAIEIYAGEHNNVIGPVVSGSTHMGKNKFGYEAGVLFGTDDESPDTTVKVMIEYEF